MQKQVVKNKNIKSAFFLLLIFSTSLLFSNDIVWNGINAYTKDKEYIDILREYTKIHHKKIYEDRFHSNYIPSKKIYPRCIDYPDGFDDPLLNNTVTYWSCKPVRYTESFPAYDESIRLKFYIFLNTKEKLSILSNYIITHKYNLVKGKFEKVSKFQKRVKYVKDNIDTITSSTMNNVYNYVYGKPRITAIDYDSKNEIFYGKLTSSKTNYSKKIAIKVSIDKAEDFYGNVNNITPTVIYTFKDDKLTLSNIIVKYKSKEYIAMLRTDDYKSSEIKIALKAQAIKYSKSKIKKLEIDDLPKLLADSNSVRKNKKAYAIIFGIEDYLLESNVNYSKNSAIMFMQYANKLLGVPDDNIWAFVGDRKTTTGYITSLWKDYLSLIEDGATVYFYYSGHGVPGNDGNAYILPSDTNAETATNNKSFMLKNIYSDLSKTKSKRVVAFIDSCFSGKDDNGSLLFEGVAPVLKVKKTIFDKSKMTIFTAGSSKNFSNQYKEKKHRLFSYYLMKGIALGKTDTKDLFTYVKKNVANKSIKLGVAYKQIPELMGKNDGRIR